MRPKKMKERKVYRPLSVIIQIRTKVAKLQAELNEERAMKGLKAITQSVIVERALNKLDEKDISDLSQKNFDT